MAAAKKPDRRTERTREALLEAFRDLVLDRGYEGMTVLDVIERAQVGRSTFYEHFENKDHLFRQSMQPLLGLLAGAVNPGAGLAKVVIVLEHFWHNRRLARALLRGAMRDIVASFLAELIEEQLVGLGRDSRSEPLLPVPLAAAQIAAGQIALVQAWVTGKASTTAPVLAKALCDSSAATARALIGHT